MLAALAACQDYDVGRHPGDDDSTGDDDSSGDDDSIGDDDSGAVPGGPRAEVDADRLLFAWLPPGRSSTLVARVWNVGDADLTLLSAVLDPESSADFGVEADPQPPASLEPGGEARVSVRYGPTDLLPDSGTLLVGTDDPGGPILRVQLAVQPCDVSSWTVPFFAQPGEGGSAVELREALGGGGFGEPVVLGGVPDDPFAGIVVADADGDLSLEAWATTSAGRVLRYARGCDGGWHGSEQPPLPFPVAGAGDLDGDGRADLFGWDSGGLGHTAYGQADGGLIPVAGTFDVAGLADPWGGPDPVAVPRAADLTGDGAPDLVVVAAAGDGTGEAQVLPGLGDGTFGAAARAGGLPGWPGAADLGDVDGDGWVDLWAGLGPTADAGESWLLRGAPGGLEAPVPSFDVAPEVEGPHPCCAGAARLHDWDGDGLPEALAGWFTGEGVDPVVALLGGDGTPIFGPPVELLPVGTARSLAVAVPVE